MIFPPSQKAVIAHDILPMLEEEAKARQRATLKQNTVKEIIPERREINILSDSGHQQRLHRELKDRIEYSGEADTLNR